MAKFRGTVQGMKSEASRLGSANSGLTTACQGWNLGIKVYAEVDSNGYDQFTVYRTSGSNHSEPDVKIYSTKDNNDTR